ncbi:MAG TPA: hypothetical protein DDY78_24040 [Planctomycetales bacterium]|nr:hypothetical protein [Planctomycetales bacterium]
MNSFFVDTTAGRPHHGAIPVAPAGRVGPGVRLTSLERTTMKRLLRIASRCLPAAAVVLFLTALPNGYAADKSAPPPKAAATPLDFVPSDAVVFVTVRIADLSKHPLVQTWREIGMKVPAPLQDFRSPLDFLGPLNFLAPLEHLQPINSEWGAAPEEVERLTEFSGKGFSLTAVTTLKPYDRKVVLAAIAKIESRIVSITPTDGHTPSVISKDSLPVHFFDERTFIVGFKNSMDNYLHGTPGKKEGPALPALRLAAEKHLVVVGMNWPAYARIYWQADKLPPSVKPYAPLSKAQFVTLVVDLNDQLKANLRLTFADEADAKAAAASLDSALGVVRDQFALKAATFSKYVQSPKMTALLDDVQTALKAAKADPKGATVTVETALKIDPDATKAALTEGASRMEKAAKSDTIPNDLKQLALASMSYADALGTLPTDLYDKSGKPLLSWRVLLLPYTEGGKLYGEFHLDEPWDSEHNKKLLAKMPEIFAPKDTEAYKNHETFFQAFAGKGAMLEPPANPKPGRFDNGLRYPFDIPDGLSNTILFVEAKKAVPWSKPDDIPFDAGKLLPKVGGLSNGGFWAVMCDGSVRFIPLTAKEEALRAWIKRNTGEAKPSLGK